MTGRSFISALLAGSSLRERFHVDILKSNVRSSNAAKGAWDMQGVTRVASISVSLFLRLLFHRPSLVYMTLSQNSSGLARDAAYLMICRLFRVPAVAHLHGSKLLDYLNSRPPVVRGRIVRMLESFRSIVTCADSITKELATAIPSARFETVYNACPPAPSAPTRLTHETLTVGFMGHLSAAKGFYDLIAAADLVLSIYPQTRFEFAGERLDNERNVTATVTKGSDWGKVESIMKRFPDNFRWRGIVTGKDKQVFWDSCDVFALPSYAEAFPVAVLEAMQAGIPLIVTPVGALPEILRDHVNGFFVPIGDAAAIADRILQLIRSRPAREKMSEENRLAAKRFSVERMVQAMMSVFERALAAA